ncbi:MAG: triose-phosphate isomerase [Acidobacteria bacterium]|nr:triose-phosphate isomerase [Acidobacteriota bacterium]MCW5950594.1 triose-phosphate isomerase [Pyrinomonadaceae bacterium]
MRKPVIAGNWKMYKLIGESIESAVSLKPLVANAFHAEVIIAPVYTALRSVADRLDGSNIKVAAQNCSVQNEFGALTGEIAPVMIKDAGCSHVIIGHSERRQFFAETDETVNRKVKAALGAGLIAIVCVGEDLASRDAGTQNVVVEEQVIAGLNGLTVSDMERIIIAYEPVWAIGTGRTATPVQAQEMHAHIRHLIAATHGNQVAEALRILYGGSVKPENIAELMACEDVDGALVGGASLSAESFAGIVNYTG